MGDLLNASKDSIKVHSAYVKDLSAKMYSSLLSLNYRERGYMKSELMRVRRYKCDKSKVFFITNSDNKVLGWSLVFPKTGWFGNKQEVHFYVRVSEREKGYGSMLAESIAKAYKGRRLCGSVTESSLFRRFGMESVYA